MDLYTYIYIYDICIYIHTRTLHSKSCGKIRRVEKGRCRADAARAFQGTSSPLHGRGHTRSSTRLELNRRGSQPSAALIEEAMTHHDMVDDRWCGLRKARDRVMRCMLAHDNLHTGGRKGMPVHEHAA